MKNQVQSLGDEAIEFIKDELERADPSRKKEVFEKFTLAALGSIPWVGGFISAAVSLKFDEGNRRTDTLQTRWLQEHLVKIERLKQTISQISERFDALGDEVKERIESEDYLNLVRKSFRVWDSSDTDTKRQYVANMIANAGGTRLCSDELVHLFIEWLDSYNDAHFLVIREVFQKPNITRYEIWQNINGEFPREDSAEADLFKRLIRDLSTGGVLRQYRETTSGGQYLQRSKSNTRIRKGSRILESAFEDSKPYVLTELGKQFVHYAMNDVVSRLD